MSEEYYRDERRGLRTKSETLGTQDFLIDPRITKLPPAALHKLLVKHMGQNYIDLRASGEQVKSKRLKK